MSLKYPVFASNKKIQDAYRNSPPLKRGAKGLTVALLQGALIDLGHKLPISTLKKGVPDGIYGEETASAVRQFQADKKLKKDGIAGKNTIGMLDRILSAKTSLPPKKIPKPPPAIPASRDYKIGKVDPSVTRDIGSGVWNSKPKSASYIALKNAIIVEVLPKAYVLIGDDAAKHLVQYFNNRVTNYRIDLEGMVKDVPSAKKLYELEVVQAKAFTETLPVGSHFITSRRPQGGYNSKAESKNWFFAVGGYSVWGKGQAIVKNGSAGKQYELNFEYKFFDRYNWDTGKKVDIFGIEISDAFMGEFHKQGLAREYDEIGSFKRRFKWNVGQAIPSDQY